MTSDEQARLRRMRHVWQREAASEFEVETARQRYVQRRRDARPRSLLVEFGLGLGFAALVLAGLQLLRGTTEQWGHEGGASMNAERQLEASPRDGTPPAESSDGHAGSTPASGATSTTLATSVAPVAATFRASLRVGEREVEVVPATRYAVAAGQSAVVSLGDTTQTVEGPAVLEFQLDPARASGWRMKVERPLPGTTRPVAPDGAGGRRSKSPSDLPETLELLPAPGSSAPSSVGSFGQLPAPRDPALKQAETAENEASSANWSAVAEAMRRGDHGRAQIALERLIQGSTGGTRQSAQLTLAQLWLAQGRTSEARAVLQQLAASGATEFIRHRAAELLNE